jgi:hypothetical protein
MDNWDGSNVDVALVATVFFAYALKKERATVATPLEFLLTSAQYGSGLKIDGITKPLKNNTETIVTPYFKAAIISYSNNGRITDEEIKIMVKHFLRQVKITRGLFATAAFSLSTKGKTTTSRAKILSLLPSATAQLWTELSPWFLDTLTRGAFF